MEQICSTLDRLFNCSSVRVSRFEFQIVPAGSVFGGLLLPGEAGREAYTNGDGSVQFIELFSSVSNQQFLDGHSLTYIVNGTTTSTVNFTDLGADSLNKAVLIGTSNLTTLYGVTPDFVIPANFFSAGANNTLSFGPGQDIINLTNLPGGGVQSLDGLVGNDGQTAGDTAINAQATPTNFAGNTAVIPEPGAVSLSLIASISLILRRKRRFSVRT